MHDIEIINRTNNALLFFRDISAVTGKDVLWVRTDLGLSNFASLGPPGSIPSRFGVAAAFDSPLASTTTVTTLDANGQLTSPVKLTADGELHLFARDPDELYQTLLGEQPTGPSWLEDISTPRAFPLGESVPTVDPTPFSVPAEVVMGVYDPLQQHCGQKGCAWSNLDVVDPVGSSFFWNIDFGSGFAPVSDWGPPGNVPLGFGSIKAARFIQHGPCEYELGLQQKLEDTRVQLVQSLALCGQFFGPFSVKDIKYRTVDATPYVSRVPSPSGFGGAFETVFGLLLHGDMEIFTPQTLIATAPCEVDFLWDYRLVVSNGLLRVTRTPVYYHHLGGYCTVADGLLKDGLDVTVGFTTVHIDPLLNKQLPDQINQFLQAAQFRDLAQMPGAGVAFSGPTGKCHTAADPMGPASCVAAANKLEEPFVHDGICRFNGQSIGCKLPLNVTSTVHATLQAGATSPDGLPGHNWFCADKPTDTAEDRLSHDCQFVARVDRFAGQPDVVDVVPFDTFDEFGNTALLFFYFLMDLNALPDGSPAITQLCNRTLPATVGPDPSKSYYNKWYADTNIVGLSCANHSPAATSKKCTQNSDCSSNICDTTNQRCDGPTPCSDDSACMAWEKCTFTGCIPVQASCDTSDPFGFGNCPVGSYCNGRECWRL